MTDLVSFVNSNGMVSSKLVAEKFGKRHNDVLRAIKNASKELSSDFYERNFARNDINTLKGKETSEILMSRDGFAILAMGFTGKEAQRWKERFLDAFNRMEQAIVSEIPSLKATIARLESQRLMLSQPKPPHHARNTVLVSVPVDTIFGSDVEWRRVQRDDGRFSEQSRIEGEVQRLSKLMLGMAKKITELSKKQAKERRK